MSEAHRSGEDDLEQQVTQEVVRLHEFISGWFRGEVSHETFDVAFGDVLHPDFQNIQPSGMLLTKEELLQPIHVAYGSNPDFRINIEASRLIAQYSGQIVMGYVEFQQGARNSNTENRRRSTAVFETQGKYLIWRHLQETGLPHAPGGSQIDYEE